MGRRDSMDLARLRRSRFHRTSSNPLGSGVRAELRAAGLERHDELDRDQDHHRQRVGGQPARRHDASNRLVESGRLHRVEWRRSVSSGLHDSAMHARHDVGLLHVGNAVVRRHQRGLHAVAVAWLGSCRRAAAWSPRSRPGGIGPRLYKGGREKETFCRVRRAFSLRPQQVRENLGVFRKEESPGRRERHGSNRKSLMLDPESMEQTKKVMVLDDKS